MSNPTVGVICCNHNYGEYLEETINSILNQDYPNLILSIVDDNSSDNSVEIIEKFADKDFRVRPIYSKVGLGASLARNAAIKNCIKDVDLFLIADSDDICHQGKIRIMLQKVLA